MNSSSLFLRSFSGAIVVSLGLAAPVLSQTENHYWYDGQVKRKLALDSSRVAHFDQKNTARPNAVLKSSSVTGPVKKNALQAQSEVFVHGNSTRALPGGVLVSLKEPLSDDAARVLLSAAGLNPVRVVTANKVWLVQSEPGIASLELANRIHEAGRFEAAQPNWWMPVTLK
jgi:hypothetical protein